MSQQDTVFIECKKIKFANGKKGLLQSVIDTLYDSISIEGLHQAIGLRPDPDAPGNYILVYGRHRFYDVFKMCKDEVIKSQVYEDMSPEEAELATLTEDACRKNAKPNDRLLVLRRWQEIYRKNFPHLERKKASGTSRWANSTKAAAKQAAVDAEKAAHAEESNDDRGHYSSETDSSSNQKTVEVEVGGGETESEAPKKKLQTFRERVKSVTGAKELDNEPRLTDQCGSLRRAGLRARHRPCAPSWAC
jgi:ParB-like chromosome segregation protein Spo0J